MLVTVPRRCPDLGQRGRYPGGGITAIPPG